MTTPANKATILDGSPVAHPVYLVDPSGNAIVSSDADFVAVVTGASVALTSPPAQTNAGSDTTLTFSSKANHFLIQNNTAANCYVALDTAASTSSLLLVPGALWRDDIPVTSPHLYTAAAQNINGATGIVVLGWL